MNKFSILVFSIVAFVLIGCDKVDSCLDSGGCWDKVDNVCRKSEPNAQELCDRKTSFSPKPWLDDYLAQREHISKSYANLEYILKYYKIDAFELNEKTISAINASKTEKEAREALDQFVNTFKDAVEYHRSTALVCRWGKTKLSPRNSCRWLARFFV